MPGTSGARTGPGADGPDSGYEDRPSWAPAANEPGWPYPDHPSWPAGSTGRPLTPDHPSWPASAVGRPVASDDYPSWRAADPGGSWAASAGLAAAYGGPSADGGPGGPQRELPGEPPAPAMHHDPYPRHPAPHVPPARGRHVRAPGGHSEHPRPGVPADEAPQRWSTRFARNTGPIPQTYYNPAFGDGRRQVVRTETPGGDPAGPRGPGARADGMLQLPGPGPAGQPVSWDTGGHGHTDPVREAERVLADADQQAAAIRQEAASHAVAIREAAERDADEIRRQVAAEAAPLREGVEREAAEIRQLAEAQAAAIREAADREAAELRAHLAATAAEMARVASYLTKNLTSPGLPALPPPWQAGPHPRTVPVELPAGPGAGPAVEPAARSATAPGTRPRTRPATKPAARPTAKPKTRQYKAMRLTSVAAAALVVFTAAAGATEIGLHGFKFFVFRSAGTGATNGAGLTENQGPGQPGAPGAHHQAQHQRAAQAKAHGQAHQQHGKAHQAKPAKKN
jgi:hypothetical protein